MAKKRVDTGTSAVPRLGAFGGGGDDASADWTSSDCEWLQTVVVAITRLGGAVTFGLSRDMGAYMVTLLLDGERETLWFGARQDLNKEMREIVEKLDAIS